jgi:hypothetical protein
MTPIYMAIRTCCGEAHNVYLRRNNIATQAYAESNLEYAAVMAQYMPLGRYIATGVWPE